MKRSQLRMLIVDDHPQDLILLRQKLVEALPSTDCQLTHAGTLDAALALQDGAFDLVFLDYHVGGRCGIELLRIFRARAVRIPVVLLTNAGEEWAAVEALQAGAVAYLPKAKLTDTALRLAVRYAINLHHREELLRRSHQELRASEERFRALVENSDEVTVLLSAQGRVNYAAALTRVLGYEPTEVVGTSIFDLMHPDDLAQGQDLLARALAQPGRLLTGQVQFRHKEGHWRMMEGTICNRLEEPAVSAVIVNGRDITERNAMEEALRRSERDYRRLFESANDAILLLDPAEETILEANPKACQMYGFSREELIGRSLKTLTVEVNRGREELARLVQAGSGSDFETVHRHRDGTLIYCVANSSLVEYGGRKAILTINRDLSEVHRLQQQLLQVQKMDAIGKLAGGIAHDFNNLLMVISSYSDMLCASLEDERQRHRAEQVFKAAQRAADLTRQLLAFSRKQVLAPQIIDLNHVIHELDMIVARLLGDNIAVEVALAEDLGAVRADPSQLQQVLLNLVVNARDAMPGGGRLKVETARVELETMFREGFFQVPAGEYVVLAVSDTGPGIDPAILPRIFEPFFTTKERGKGTGLGLSTVYGIVEQSGGHICVFSEPGQGATFKIFLPLARGEVQAEPVEAAVEDAHGAETVLVAEDEAEVRSVVVDSLKARGYNVLAAADGDEALKTAAGLAGEIDLLLTDVTMPGSLSGPELARRLLERRPGTAVVFMSGYADDNLPRQGDSGFAPQFLQKPFGLRELARKVREALEQKAAALA